jgi:phosphinothricin acetyltransferase
VADWDRSQLASPRLVARLDGRVVGWAALARASDLPAYAGVGLVQLHVDSAVRGCGIGRRLLPRLVEGADTEGLWSLQVALVGDDGAACTSIVGAASAWWTLASELPLSTVSGAAKS